MSGTGSDLGICPLCKYSVCQSHIGLRPLSDYQLAIVRTDASKTPTDRKPTHPNLSLDDLRKLIVPDFNAIGDDALSTLAAAYDRHAADVLLPLPQMESCEVRRGLDVDVCAALGMDEEVVEAIRRQLGSEPSVTGARYGG